MPGSAVTDRKLCLPEMLMRPPIAGTGQADSRKVQPADFKALRFTKTRAAIVVDSTSRSVTQQATETAIASKSRPSRVLDDVRDFERGGRLENPKDA